MVVGLVLSGGLASWSWRSGLRSTWWLIEWVKIIEQWRLAWFVGFDRAVEIGWVVGFDQAVDSAWLDFGFWIQIGWFGLVW